MSNPDVTDSPKAPIASTPASGSASALEGYTAAGIAIERILDDAQKKRPKRQGNRKSAAYRSGFYDAILEAHCLMVWGEYPNHPINLKQIRKMIQTPNSVLGHEIDKDL